jgi:hypothetical protein
VIALLNMASNPTTTVATGPGSFEAALADFDNVAFQYTAPGLR